MSKVLIVSDSHGLDRELTELKQRHRHEVDLMIHCGDSELYAGDEAIADFLVVRGNCDYERSFQNDIIAEFAGLRFFVTHGHRYSIKSALLGLLYRAEEERANVVCFGHSHVLGAEMVNNILFINPGSLRLPRGRLEKTYCILDIENNKAELEVFDFNRGKIADLGKTFYFSKGEN